MYSGQFTILGEEVEVSRRVFESNDDARREAALIAREHPGQTIHVAVVVDSVIEPLMPLRWDSGLQTDAMAKSSHRTMGVQDVRPGGPGPAGSANPNQKDVHHA